MNIDFQYPLGLLLFPITIVFLYFTIRKENLKLGSAFMKRYSIFVVSRFLILSFLILAISGAGIRAEKTTTILLVDISDSMKHSHKEELAYVNKAISSKKANEKVMVVSFGEKPLLETLSSKKIKAFKNHASQYSNIEEAMDYSTSLLPKDAGKKIIVLTDGNENIGKVYDLADKLKAHGIELSSHSFESNSGREASINNVSIPPKLSKGEEFDIDVDIWSNINQNSTITISNNETKSNSTLLALKKGLNRYVFHDKAVSGGYQTYKVSISPDNDRDKINNTYYCCTNVTEKSKVLVVQDTPGEGDEIVKMLKSSNTPYEMADASNAPNTVQALSKYKSVITCNVSADNLSDGFLNSLYSFVKDFGGGYIASGGNNSFALGGYFQTKLEEILPVSMRIKSKKKLPSMAVMLVIDKSSSMTMSSGGVRKMDMAKEAAIRALQSLRSKDYIGVVAFSDSPKMTVKPQKVKNKGHIEKSINGIEAYGDTRIIPALYSATEPLSTIKTNIKHIILLTDGMGEYEDFSPVIAEINKYKISVSTIAVGKSSNKQLLKEIAEQSGGKYYTSDDSQRIPRIFAKETFRVSRNYLNNRTFAPKVINNHSILDNIPTAELPQLKGYVASTKKATALGILKSDQNHPILTVWNFGLGRSCAWNSDMNGSWSSNYVNWKHNLSLWQNIISWTSGKTSNSNTYIEPSVVSNKEIIKFVDPSKTPATKVTATILTSNSKEIKMSLNEELPGEFSNSFKRLPDGGRIVSAIQTKNGKIINSASTSYSASYSPEHLTYSANSTFTKLMAAMKGQPHKNESGDANTSKVRIDFTNYLLLASAFLLVTDIILRRLKVNPFAYISRHFS